MYIFSSFYYFGLLFTYFLLACVLTRWNLIPSIWFCFSNSTTEFELRYSVFKVLPKFSIIEFRAPCDYASALGFSATGGSQATTFGFTNTEYREVNLGKYRQENLGAHRPCPAEARKSKSGSALCLRASAFRQSNAGAMVGTV
ncbi:TPA: hypothetical protein DIS55_00885 [Candidatus Kaiserbacteria bacterium]|nr:hypothetical protein [Candidatus Kaiserbacteria bacterium]